jgi:hypothetical protein
VGERTEDQIPRARRERRGGRGSLRGGRVRDDRQFFDAVVTLERFAGVRHSPIGADQPVPRVIVSELSALRTRAGGPTLGEVFAIGEPEIWRAITSLIAAVEDPKGSSETAEGGGRQTRAVPEPQGVYRS